MRSMLVCLMFAACMAQNPRAHENPTEPLFIEPPRPGQVAVAPAATRPERLHGVVHLGDGVFPTPVDNVRVELLQDDRVAFRTTTDHGGRFEFGPVPLGTYELRVSGTHVAATQITWRGTARERFEIIAQPR